MKNNSRQIFVTPLSFSSKNSICKLNFKRSFELKLFKWITSTKGVNVGENYRKVRDQIERHVLYCSFYDHAIIFRSVLSRIISAAELL